MINNVTLVGRLTKDPELRTTGNGTSVAMFTLAVERNYTDQQGNRQADFINCVIWRKAAETFCNFTSKGTLIGLTGSIQTRSYDDKDGKRVFVTEVLVNEFNFLESRRERENRMQNSNNYQTNQNNQNQYGQQYSRTQTNQSNSNQSNSNQTQATQGMQGSTKAPADPFNGNNDSIDISSDDLPF